MRQLGRSQKHIVEYWEYSSSKLLSDTSSVTCVYTVMCTQFFDATFPCYQEVLDCNRGKTIGTGCLAVMAARPKNWHIIFIQQRSTNYITAYRELPTFQQGSAWRERTACKPQSVRHWASVRTLTQTTRRNH